MTLAPNTEHRVAIIVDGKVISNPLEYSIAVSMVTPADAFSMSLPWDPEVWKLVKNDRPVLVTIDGVPILTGHLTDRDRSTAAGIISVAGLDKVGRLVAESAPQVEFAGLTMVALIKLVAAPWFTKVVLSNARNRRVLRGKGHKAGDAGPVYVDTSAGTRIEPGQPRWSVIVNLAEQAGYAVWSSGDGRELVVGQPNVTQEVQYRFRHVKQGNPLGDNVIDIREHYSTGDRYSSITVLGHGSGNHGNYGTGPADRSATVKDNPDTEWGTGLDFFQPKRLVIAERDDVRNAKEALRQAKRHQAAQDLRRHVLAIDVPHHGQLVAGQKRTLYTYDTLCHVYDEDVGLSKSMLILGCTYSANRKDGERTTLEVVPKNIRIPS